MNITKDYLTINPSNRPGIVRAETLATVLHSVGGKSKQTAKQIRNYFESLANGLSAVLYRVAGRNHPDHARERKGISCRACWSEGSCFREVLY
jgi:hypothetical protein